MLPTGGRKILLRQPRTRLDADTIAPAGVLLDEGRVMATNGATSSYNWAGCISNQGRVTGKLYWEFQRFGSADDRWQIIGIARYVKAPAFGSPHEGAGCTTYDFGFANGGSGGFTNGTAISGLTLPAASGTTFSLCADVDAGKFWFGINGVFSGDPVAGTGHYLSFTTTSPVYILMQIWRTETSHRLNLKTRPSDIKYTPPAGYRTWDN